MSVMAALVVIAAMHSVTDTDTGTASAAGGARSMRTIDGRPLDADDLRTIDGQHQNTTGRLELFQSRVWQPDSDMVCRRYHFVPTFNLAHPHIAVAMALAMLLSVVMFELRGNPNRAGKKVTQKTAAQVTLFALAPGGG